MQSGRAAKRLDERLLRQFRPGERWRGGGDEVRPIRLRSGEARRAHQPARASQRAVAELDAEKALAIHRAGQPEAFRQLRGKPKRS